MSIRLPEELLRGLSERQKAIVKRLVETGQRNVLENVLETSRNQGNSYKVAEKTLLFRGKCVSLHPIY